MATVIANYVKAARRIETTRQASVRSFGLASDSEALKTLRQVFSNNQSLVKLRERNSNRIKQINEQYAEATKNVLNKDTLDFLVSHSMIDVPTLTSIFAGFELARASAADRLNLAREDTLAEITRDEQTNTQQAQVINQEIQAESEVEQRGIAREVQLTGQQASVQTGIAGQILQAGQTIEGRVFQADQNLLNRESAERNAETRATARISQQTSSGFLNSLNKVVGESGTFSTTEVITDDTTVIDAPIGLTPSEQVLQPVVDTTIPSSSESLSDSEREALQQERDRLNEDSDLLSIPVGGSISQLSANELRFIQQQREFDIGGPPPAPLQLDPVQTVPDIDSIAQPVDESAGIDDAAVNEQFRDVIQQEVVVNEVGEGVGLNSDLQRQLESVNSQFELNFTEDQLIATLIANDIDPANATIEDVLALRAQV